MILSLGRQEVNGSGAYCHTALCRKCGSALFSLLIEFLFGDKLNIHTIEVLQNSFLGQGHLFV